VPKLRRLPERISRQDAKEDAKSAKGIRDILGALGVLLFALARNAFVKLFGCWNHSRYTESPSASSRILSGMGRAW
jgi:hypothetical protein